jgi:hypothetical protein
MFRILTNNEKNAFAFYNLAFAHRLRIDGETFIYFLLLLICSRKFYYTVITVSSIDSALDDPQLVSNLPMGKPITSNNNPSFVEGDQRGSLST